MPGLIGKHRQATGLLQRKPLRVAALVFGILLALPWDGVHLLLPGIKLTLASMLLTYAMMPLVIWLAWRAGAIDQPEARRLHSEPTPRIGGLALVFAINLTLLLNFNFSLELKGVGVSALIVALVSLWDDVRGLSAGIKLAVQLLALGVLWYCGVHVELVSDGWWGMLIEFSLTALWMIGITNAFNFLDGVNGLAASLAAAVCTVMAVLAWHTGQQYMLMLCLSLLGGALGFLPDNARYKTPARIFLGDTGSTYLGWMMAGVAVMGGWSSEGAVRAYSAPLLIFSVMIFDMIYTTVARIVRGDVRNVREWIEFVGRDHLHHRLMSLGCSPLQTVMFIVAIALMTGMAALAIVESSTLAVALLLLQSILFYSVLSFIMLKRKPDVGS